MIDIGAVYRHLDPQGQAFQLIQPIQAKGATLATRISAVFNLVGHRAYEFETNSGKVYQALIHSESDVDDEVLVVHPSGVSEPSFRAVNGDEGWATMLIDDECYNELMDIVSAHLLECANAVYREFMAQNKQPEPTPLTEVDLDLNDFAEDLAELDISMSHAGNKRLVY